MNCDGSGPMARPGTVYAELQSAPTTAAGTRSEGQAFRRVLLVGGIICAVLVAQLFTSRGPGPGSSLPLGWAALLILSGMTVNIAGTVPMSWRQALRLFGLVAVLSGVGVHAVAWLAQSLGHPMEHFPILTPPQGIGDWAVAIIAYIFYAFVLLVSARALSLSTVAARGCSVAWVRLLILFFELSALAALIRWVVRQW